MSRACLELAGIGCALETGAATVGAAAFLALERIGAAGNAIANNPELAHKLMESANLWQRLTDSNLINAGLVSVDPLTIARTVAIGATIGLAVFNSSLLGFKIIK